MSKTWSLPLRNVEFNRLNGSHLHYPPSALEMCGAVVIVTDTDVLLEFSVWGCITMNCPTQSSCRGPVEKHWAKENNNNIIYYYAIIV